MISREKSQKKEKIGGIGGTFPPRSGGHVLRKNRNFVSTITRELVELSVVESTVRSQDFDMLDCCRAVNCQVSKTPISPDLKEAS